MKKKSIMGLEYKWEVFLVYFLTILGFIFSFMKDKDVDKDVKFQYNQAGAVFIVNLAINILSQVFTRGIGVAYISYVLAVLQLVLFIFVIITIVKAFKNETYRIPVIADFSEKIWK